MINERLFKLAHEALEAQWNEAYETSKANPENYSYKRKEIALLDELLELEFEMKNRGYRK